MTYEEATANFWILDADGLITVKREKQLSSTVEPFARKTQADVEGEKLAATVQRVLCSLYTSWFTARSHRLLGILCHVTSKTVMPCTILHGESHRFLRSRQPVCLEYTSYKSQVNSVPHKKPALQVKPTVLIGLAGAGKLFTEEVLTTMGEHNERPIIMYAFLVPRRGSPIPLGSHVRLLDGMMPTDCCPVSAHSRCGAQGHQGELCAGR